MPGYQYAVKMPDYDGDGLVPYPTSMFAFELPPNYQMIACTGLQPTGSMITNARGEQEEEIEYLFEFIQYKPQVAQSAAEFRGLAQPYESNHPGHLKQRRQLGPVHTGQAEKHDMVRAPADVQVQPPAQPPAPAQQVQATAAPSVPTPPPPGELTRLG